MRDELFNPDPFEQLPGQMSFERESSESETWRVTIATDHGARYFYPEARSAAAAVNSAQITIDAFCWQGAEIVAVERDS
jgi:hypothetical protein